jgi:hypothetical protein
MVEGQWGVKGQQVPLTCTKNDGFDGKSRRSGNVKAKDKISYIPDGHSAGWKEHKPEVMVVCIAQGMGGA